MLSPYNSFQNILSFNLNIYFVQELMKSNINVKISENIKHIKIIK